MRQQDVFKLPDGKHHVGDGLVLHVRGNSRTWVLRKQVNGRRIDRGLGSAQTITLAMAKERASKLIIALNEGTPVEETKKTIQPKIVESSSDAIPFSIVAHEAIDKKAEIVRYKQERSVQRMHNMIDTYAERINSMPIDAISCDDVLEILRPVWYSKPETGKRLRIILEFVFAYAERNNLRTGNPAIWRNNLALQLPPRAKIAPTEHFEAPTLDELKEICPKLLATRQIGALCTLFVILTASRTQEACLAKWDEIDFKSETWSVPPERRKDGRPYPHRVPLSKQALKILEYVPRTSEYVFVGSRASHINKETPRITLTRALERSVTAHGCRSTFRDWAAENDIDDKLAEKSLMHATGSAVVQAYQRSDLLKQRRPVMQKWADELLGG